jgi:C4-dicarboxylate-specific signal transduction histidine kinase
MSSDADRGKALREKELAFFGAVTASISHDLNNAIAIIEQTAGLLEDLVVGSEAGRPISNEQLQKIADRIAKQTKRGATIVRRLNAFAHTVDEDVKELELNALIQTVIALAHRLADRKQVALDAELTAEPIHIRGSAFRVQQAVFLSIQRAVAATEEGATVMLSAGDQDSSAWILVEAGGPEAPPPASDNYLGPLMTQIGGRVEESTSDGKLSFRLVFPN